MNKLYENKLRNVLTLLESSVDADTELAEVKLLAQKHQRNVKKIEELEAQIQELTAKRDALEDSNEVIKQDIMDIIGDTKNQIVRFGKLIVEMIVKRQTGKTKSSPQWKEVAYEVARLGDIEEKIVNDLALKFNKGNKEFTTVDKSLDIRTESYSINEGLGDYITQVWIGLKGVFTRLFKSFKLSVDELEQKVAKL